MNPAMPRAFSLPPDLRQRAWKALVKELGIVDATRFVMAVEPGEGDSIEKYATLWEEMSSKRCTTRFCRPKSGVKSHPSRDACSIPNHVFQERAGEHIPSQGGP